MLFSQANDCAVPDRHTISIESRLANLAHRLCAEELGQLIFMVLGVDEKTGFVQSFLPGQGIVLVVRFKQLGSENPAGLAAVFPY